jgi:hypothetical protein
MLDKDTSLNGSMHHSTLTVSCDRRQNSNHSYMASLNFSIVTRLKQLGTTVHLQFKQVMPVKSDTVRQSNYIEKKKKLPQTYWSLSVYVRTAFPIMKDYISH